MTNISILQDSKVEPWEIREVFAAVNWKDEAELDESALDMAFNSAYCNFVARNEQNKVVGAIRASFDGMYVVLWNLVVHPDFQGIGLGSDLFQLMVSEMNGRGHSWIVGLALNERVDYYAERGLLPLRHLTVMSTYLSL